MQKAKLLRGLLAACFVLFPALVLYVLLIHQTFDFPLMDDYDALLRTVSDLRLRGSFPTKASDLLAAQHSEYKLWFEVAIAYLQTCISGQLNFRFLEILGDAFLIPIALLLWMLFPTGKADMSVRLLWFAPVSILFFQLADDETLNWAMAGLQNLPAIAFSGYGLYLLNRRNRTADAMAVACLVLAVSSSGNGFIFAAVGGLMLLLNRRYVLLAGWTVTILILAAGYLYHYNRFNSQVAQHRSVGTTLLHLNPIYALAFMGSLGGRHGCVALGAGLALWNGWLFYTGFFRRHPVLGYLTLFILLTAVGVAGIRSEFGLEQATSSRYRIYCMLLLCIGWTYLAELGSSWTRTARRSLLATALLVSMVGAAKADYSGYQRLRARRQYVMVGMRVYKQSLRTGSTLGPMAWTADQQGFFIANNASARSYLQRAEQAHVFHLP